VTKHKATDSRSPLQLLFHVQESRGVEVSSYKWPDSGHCQHLKQHPQEYAFQVSRFLGTALADW
jgi:hypothetical protein